MASKSAGHARSEKANKMMKTKESETQETLLALARGGDRKAFLLLVRPWQRAAFLGAKAILNNTTKAEEIVQGAILEALARIQGLQSDEKFGVWLIQMTINKARERVVEDDGRTENGPQRRSVDDETDYVPKDLSCWRVIPSEALEEREVDHALQQAFACLPQECREVLILKDAAQLSHHETAEALGLSLRQVKTRLLRARLQMRDTLSPGIRGNWSNSRSVGYQQTPTEATHFSSQATELRDGLHFRADSIEDWP
jgi:RNA polymerase sigma-70 factor (ECF subfamily)